MTPLWLRHKVVREDLAWAAGFFDGEGHTGLIKGKKLQLGIAQTHEEPLYRFAAAIGVGNVTGPYKPKTTNSKPYWRYQTAGFENVQAVIGQLWPFLGTVKRKQAKTVLTAQELKRML